MSAVRKLRRTRPRSPFLRLSAWAAGLTAAASWAFGGFFQGEVWSARRAANLERFLGELRPYPLRDEAWSWRVAGEWAAGLWRDHLAQATLATLAISVAAIVLAGLGGMLLAPWAARSFARPDPLLPSPRPAPRRRRAAWHALNGLARGLLAILRAIPEYVWAFLLLGLYGPTAWPLVLALALHNAGILGKLGADTAENLERPALEALRAAGAGRAQIGLAAVLPMAAGRFLLYLFYRWETCVREATVLGMLGAASLGFWIQDARARNLYDEMLLTMLCGAMLVIGGDGISAAVREWLRRAS